MEIEMSFKMDYSDVALSAWKKHLECHSFDNYPGVLSMQGFAKLGEIMDSREVIEELKTAIEPFWQGKIPKAGGAFGHTLYRWGGSAAAYMVLKGMLPEAYEATAKSAESLMTEQPRDSRKIFHFPTGNRNDGSEGFIWIDTVFGICPFLLWIGLATKRQEFIEECCFQMLKHHEILFDESCGLYHQAIHFNLPGALTPAHWSRGCGWAAIALAEMVCDLPDSHKDYEEILEIYRKLMAGCCKHMDEKGMLHQAMEDASTYVETSGTGLVLYAMGRGLENGLLDESKYMEPFLRGLKGLSGYIALDGSIFNCCGSCLAPGNGTIEEYEAKEWKYNDLHAFGPVILLFGQAEQLHKTGRIPALTELVK
jgi:unsaturated rhamnogalacturonyl hydrolase